jgi:hypothetical protein
MTTFVYKRGFSDAKISLKTPDEMGETTHVVRRDEDFVVPV